MERPAERYKGPLGGTRRETVLYTCPSGSQVSVEVITGIDAQADPELVRRVLSPEPLNAARCPDTGERHPIEIAVVFHDPARRVFVLVLPESQRHAELEARADLCSALAESTEFPVPGYVRGAEVVFGVRGLRARLALESDSDRQSAERSRLAARARELDERERELTRRERAIAAREAAVTAAESASAERDAAEAADRVGSSTEKLDISEAASPDVPTSPFEPIREDEITDAGAEPMRTADAPPSDAPLSEKAVIADDVPATPAPRRQAASGDTDVGTAALDGLVERWIASREPSIAGLDESGAVRIAIATPAETLDGLLAAELEVMLQLHPMPTYPLITLSISTAAGFVSGRPRPATLFFDIEDAGDRATLSALARDFSFRLDLFDTDYLPVRERTITAGLSANVQYLMTAADDILARVEAGKRSLSRSLIAYDDPGYDRFGRQRPERSEFREDVLTDLARPSRVRWAIHVCRRFSAPEGEEYLFFHRGYPLGLWHARRKAVLQRAVELGLWTGNTLARIAVTERIARSRKELVTRMARSFVELVADRDACDLDEGAVRDNWAALQGELRSLGLVPDEIMSPRTEPIDSGQLDSASGTIAKVPDVLGGGSGSGAGGGEVSELGVKSIEELIALLSDRDRRYAAAIELCGRKDPSAMRPLFSALRRMTRSEAGHVFGRLVVFGDRSVPHLVGTLGSRKGFLRQGAALALAALAADDGLEPVCDLLLSEPTEIWKEVARAIGEFGPAAVMPLVARLAGQPDHARERVAWALAHLASRGERGDIEALSRSRDAVAAGVARHALELADLARSDNRSIWSPRPGGREHTVKRAFSRRVLEALPSCSQRPGDSGELSGPAMMLSEADLLEAAELDDDIEPLDESDLLPS